MLYRSDIYKLLLKLDLSKMPVFHKKYPFMCGVHNCRSFFTNVLTIKYLQLTEINKY